MHACNNIEPIPFLSVILPSHLLCVFTAPSPSSFFFSSSTSSALSLNNQVSCSKWYQSYIFRLKMPPKTRSQDARRVDETTNLEQPQAYDHIQQQLNDTRADANTRFRELKEAMDALVSRVDTTLQKTQLSSGECSLPKAPQFPPPKRFPCSFQLD